ncbi:MAG: hypothetical protein FJ398_04070 [Verrucomicrobia bacterium]|nr:hypothetical protein [Verrucomicrobiota bacterium]
MSDLNLQSGCLVRRLLCVAAAFWPNLGWTQTAVPTFECIGLYWKPGDVEGRAASGVLPEA